MLFNSIEFIYLFLPFTFFIYFFLNEINHNIFSKIFLVFASLFFYSWWNFLYLPLILFSIIFNYLIGNNISKVYLDQKGKNKTLLIIGITINILMLVYFKYSDFFIVNFNYIFNENIPVLNLSLPLAISFFTFQQIAYLVDCFNKEIENSGFLNYCIFITFFPQLIAGPIVHHKEIIPQVSSTINKNKNFRNISVGIFIFSIGLFKKIVLADNFSIWASAGFDNTYSLDFFESWFTSFSYTFQLYFDFSGYTDMAIGAALLFNFKLPINFNSPYKSLDIQDFWRRWHITLSRFLKEYIYIPIGGNKISKYRTYLNLMTVFIIGGIWHGAGWTFILWGFLHGLGIIINRIWKIFDINLSKFISWFITFNFINFSWIFFRANNFGDALNIIKGMIGLNGIFLPSSIYDNLTFLNKFGINLETSSEKFLSSIKGDFSTLVWLFIGFVIVLFCKNTMEHISSFKSSLSNLIFNFLILTCSLFMMNRTSEFLYFNF